MSFFIVANSNPGYLVEDFKSSLDAQTIKSLEEVIININKRK